MNRNIFKLTIVSAAFGAMAVASAGAAFADVPHTDIAPLSVSAQAPGFFPFVDFEDVVEQPFENFGNRTERTFENFGDNVERQFEIFD